MMHKSRILDSGIYFQKWVTAKSNYNILFVHGACEHSSRYDSVAKYFNENNINFYSCDLKGFGKSSGTYCYVETFDDYIDNIINVKKQINNNLPIILMGHSMGGLIVLYYGIKKDDLDRIISISPAVGLKKDGNKVQKILAKILVKIFPKLKMKSGLSGDMVTRNEKIIKEYDNDPYISQKITIKWFLEFKKTMQFVQKNSEKFNKSLLMLQAGEDKVVDNKVSTSFFDKVKCKNKKKYRFEKAYHEILNEEIKTKALNKIIKWIYKR